MDSRASALFWSRLFLLFSLFFAGNELWSENPVAPTFQEQFIFSSVVLESGSASFVGDDGRSADSSIPPGTLLKTDATIEVGMDGMAEIRLGCGSVVRLAPGSRFAIRQFGLDLLSGAILARHVGNTFPMKIQGASTLLVSKDSLIDVERQGDSLLARVQVGKMKTPGMREAVVAGQSIQASGKTAKQVPFGPSPRAWDSPTLLAPGNTLKKEPSEPAAAAAAEPQIPDPGSEKLPESPSTSGSPGETQMAEEWMKNPVPVDQDAK